MITTNRIKAFLDDLALVSAKHGLELHAELGKTVEIVVYEAQHGFNADYRPSYDKASSEDAMSRLHAWFKKYGAA